MMILSLLLVSSFVSSISIRPARADGVIYIRADGSIDPSDAPIQRDGDTYTFTANVTDSSIVSQRDNMTLDGDGFTLQGTGASDSIGIDLSERTNVTVKNTRITNNHVGINSYSSFNNSISGNSITTNDYGVFLGIYSSNNSICGNNITNNTDGIDLEGCSNSSINGNDITANNYIGIRLWCSSSNSVSGNNITNNHNGIYLYASSNNNSVSGNNITTNYDYGILDSDSSNNSISGNNIANNRYGIMLGSSSNNKIYHNNFISNVIQVSCDQSINVWDDGYPSGGNYWSDYTGIDEKSGPYQNETGYDWIGDSPYIINQKNVDKYPLIQPFVPEMEKIRLAYRNLLLKYTETYSNLEALNSTMLTLINNTQGQYISMISQLNNILNVMYIFIAATVILTAATIHLARKRR